MIEPQHFVTRIRPLRTKPPVPTWLAVVLAIVAGVALFALIGGR